MFMRLLPMWIWKIASGELWLDGQHVATGYSGFGDGKNNPLAQGIRNVGPIPCGLYTIGQPFDSPDHGPFCLRLTPNADTNELGRSGFLIHGDSKEHPGAASHGCIILPRHQREQVAKFSGFLKVIER